MQPLLFTNFANITSLQETAFLPKWSLFQAERLPHKQRAPARESGGFSEDSRDVKLNVAGRASADNCWPLAFEIEPFDLKA
jgi:hypothetical protein